jgi:hypothetical protein
MTSPGRILFGILLAACQLAVVISVAASPQSSDLLLYPKSFPDSESSSLANRAPSLFKPVAKPAEQPERGVDWRHLFKQSMFFLMMENAFRCATEDGTREGFSNPFFRGYFNSVGNLHGWDDQDPFIVNYVGHPMQGAVTGYLWTQNDRAYRDIQFGKNRRYWKGKLRGAAFSYVYSALFEIGPMSEASIGNIQGEYPQQGFVDHIVTPAIGLGWSITEDALDQYFIRWLETRTNKTWPILLVRSGLNPSRSMANVFAHKFPWHRDNRPGVRSGLLQDSEYMNSLSIRNTGYEPASPPHGVAPFEFNLTAKYKTYLGEEHSGPCVGGGGSAGFRMAATWQFVIDVSGCKQLGLEENLSGDSLTYLAGVRWVPQPSKHWAPHAEVLVGGTKLTQELVNPELEKAIEASIKAGFKPTVDNNALHAQYSKNWETNGLTIQAGSGLDLKFNNALSFRIANLEYSHSWNNDINGRSYGNGLQFTSGLILLMGTW